MNIIQSLTDYLRDSKSELEKVSWPSKTDTIRYSTLVVVVSLVVAGFFASLDYGLDTVVAAALNQKTSAEATQPAEQVPTTDNPSLVPGLDIEQSSTTLIAPIIPSTTQTLPVTN